MLQNDRVPGGLPSTAELSRVALLAHNLAGGRVALVGGLAMSHYGSPRLTKGVDVVSREMPPADCGLTRKAALSFGGATFATSSGIDLGWIVRSDDFRPVYEEALDAARPTAGGVLVVPSEYLAVMKFATLRPRDYEDLMFLLGESSRVDREGATALVYRLLGGRFALDQFSAAIQEAEWRYRKDRGEALP